VKTCMLQLQHLHTFTSFSFLPFLFFFSFGLLSRFGQQTVTVAEREPLLGLHNLAAPGEPHRLSP